MTFLKHKLNKVLLITTGLTIPIGLSSGLVFNIVNSRTKTKNIINTNLNNDVLTLNDSNNLQDSSVPYWSLDKINFIHNKIDYKKQFNRVDFSQLFNTSDSINQKQYIRNLTIASNIKFNHTNQYTNFEQIKINNLSSTIDFINDNYQYRYIKNQNNNLNNVAVTKPQYFNAKNKETYSEINTGYFDFSLLKANTVTNHLKYNLNAITVDPNSPETILFRNDFYTVASSNYIQFIDNQFQQTNAKQLIVDWSSEQLKNVPGNFIDTSTADFWIQLLLKFPSHNRIVVKPANMIIYRSNNTIPKYNIPLSRESMKYLVNGNKIGIEDWMRSCINTNPSPNFDFRSALNTEVIQQLQEINIPLIINVNDQQYMNEKITTEPNSIVDNMLYATNNNIDNRNWGNSYFQNLSKLIISMNGSNHYFDITDANKLDLATNYTNAIANTGFSDSSQGPIFSNQFFTMPNLAEFSSNNINIFLRNIKAVSYLPLLKLFDSNISSASYLRYENLVTSFLCEQQNLSGYNFNLKKFNASANTNSISSDYIINNLNSYLNFFNNSREEPYTYHYFESEHNQWKSFDVLLNSSDDNRYEFLYGFYHYLTSIVFPFSMIKNIMNQDNPLYLKPGSFGVNNINISRFIDPMTNTIFYNSRLYIQAQESYYPSFLLTNNTFENFIDKKLQALPPGQEPVLDLTFQDWVDNCWTAIDPNLDIFYVMNKKGVTFNNFVIPNILQMNVVDNVDYLNDRIVNDNLIITIVLIILISVFSLVAVIVVILILKSRKYSKWMQEKVRDTYSY